MYSCNFPFSSSIETEVRSKNFRYTSLGFVPRSKLSTVVVTRNTLPQILSEIKPCPGWRPKWLQIARTAFLSGFPSSHSTPTRRFSYPQIRRSRREYQKTERSKPAQSRISSFGRKHGTSPRKTFCSPAECRVHNKNATSSPRALESISMRCELCAVFCSKGGRGPYRTYAGQVHPTIRRKSPEDHGGRCDAISGLCGLYCLYQVVNPFTASARPTLGGRLGNSDE